jgi:hypothetical protein
MASFDDRDKAEEARWKQNEEVKIRVMARRNKLLGLWAAEQMGLAGEEADAYAKEIVELLFGQAGDYGMLQKISADLAAKGRSVGEEELRSQIDRCLTQAKAQLIT